MIEREEYPEDVKVRMAGLVNESQIRKDVSSLAKATSTADKRVRPKAAKAAKYKRKGY